MEGVRNVMLNDAHSLNCVSKSQIKQCGRCGQWKPQIGGFGSTAWRKGYGVSRLCLVLVSSPSLGRNNGVRGRGVDVGCLIGASNCIG